MIRKFIVLLSISLLTFYVSTYAQSIADIQSPKILPPSPDAAALGKYGQIPVDKSTGIPNISVPLYDIKTPRFTLPISLSYHASGIKVDETASWVGLGWSLNAGGVVTRSIQGLPDDCSNGYLYKTVPKSVDSIFLPADFHADSSLIEDVIADRLDSQPDNFFYNFVGQSGAFVFGPDTHRTPLIIPYKPLQITYKANTSQITSFTIKDGEGNAYVFGATEFSTSTYNAQMSGVTSWYLSQMISADKSDTLKFYYKPDSGTFIDNSYSALQNLGSQGQGPGVFVWQLMSTTNTSHVQEQHLDSIVYKGGKVTFIPKAGRKDNGTVSLDSVNVYNYDYNQKKYSRLKSFKLLTDYFHSGLTNPTPYNSNTDSVSKYRLKLTGLQESDANNAAIKTHSFAYNSTMLPPVHNFGQDIWGYYNGNYTNPTLLQTQYVSGIGSNTQNQAFTIGGPGLGGDRSVSPFYMQAGVLTQITYPTKGYTAFTYEPQQYLAPAVTTYSPDASSVGVYADTAYVTFTPGFLNPNQTTGQLVFHVHLANIVNISNSYVKLLQNGTVIYYYTPSSTANVDQDVSITVTAGLQYELMAVSIGGSSSNLSALPVSAFSTTYQISGTPVATNVGGLRIKTIQNYDSNGTLLTSDRYKYGPNESGAGDFLTAAPLLTNISEHLYQFYPTGTTQVTTYSNSSVYALSSLSGSPVGYEQVAVYHGDTVNNIGKSVYNYTITPDSIMMYYDVQDLIRAPEAVQLCQNCKITYMYWNTSSYFQIEGIKPIPVMWKNSEPISELEYRNNGSGQYVLEQFKSTSYKLFPRAAGRGVYMHFIMEFYNCNRGSFAGYISNCDNYIIYEYPISTGSRQPTQTTTTNYAADGVTQTSSTKTNYYYDNLTHMQPTGIVSYDSKGDSTLKAVKYPLDMTGAVYTAMSDSNIISPVIQFTQTKDGQQLMQSVTNYSATNGNYNPQTVSLQVLSNPAETRLNYQKYDNNSNLLTVSKQNGDPVSYIWGYKGEYPVAEVKNAKSNDIFFEGFEDGNSNSVSGDAKTGNYSHMDAYSKALTGLDNGSYILSYWQKNGSVWVFNNTTVTVSAGTYTISLNAQVDNIRFYPVTAQMTTYTYIPQVGVSSVTDAKGEITYYEYDTMQRLLNIRDQYKNIVKSYCYNYAGQTTGCYIELPSFKNAAKSGSFQKSNCGTGYTGSLVTYNVPAGTFTSNVSQTQADSMATAEVTKNGQAYANDYGTCIQNIGFTFNNTTTASSPTGVAVGMQITFSGPVNLTFTMPSSGTQVVQVPTGTYFISVGSDQNHYPHHIQLGSGTPVYNPSTGFSGVSIATGSSTLSLTISN